MDFISSLDDNINYTLTCGDCSWCIVNISGSGHFEYFICSNDTRHPEDKLTDKCHLL